MPMLTPDNAHGYKMPKHARPILAGAIALLFLAGAGQTANAIHKQHQAEAARNLAEQRADQLDRASGAIQSRTEALLKANHRLLAHGQQPVKIPHVPTPRPSTGPEGPEGQPGPSPTRAQVFAAVADFCALGACEHGPSAEQVETAVSVYCAVRNQCRGAQGAPGATGVGVPGAP